MLNHRNIRASPTFNFQPGTLLVDVPVGGSVDVAVLGALLVEVSTDCFVGTVVSVFESELASTCFTPGRISFTASGAYELPASGTSILLHTSPSTVQYSDASIAAVSLAINFRVNVDFPALATERGGFGINILGIGSSFGFGEIQTSFFLVLEESTYFTKILPTGALTTTGITVVGIATASLCVSLSHKARKYKCGRGEKNKKLFHIFSPDDGGSSNKQISCTQLQETMFVPIFYDLPALDDRK